MTKISNIVKITNQNDLKSFFYKYGENVHIMMSIITNTTNDSIKNMISSFMKENSNLYKNVYFIIYMVNEENISKIASSFPKDKNSYPYVVYMYNNNQVLFQTTNVTTLKKIKESFDIVKTYYDELNNNENENDNMNADEPSNRNDIDVSHENNNLKINDVKQVEEMDLLLEKKKIADKILLFIKYKEDHKTIFVEDIRRRKHAEKKYFENNDDTVNKIKSVNKKNNDSNQHTKNKNKKK